MGTKSKLKKAETTQAQIVKLEDLENENNTGDLEQQDEVLINQLLVN